MTLPNNDVITARREERLQSIRDRTLIGEGLLLGSEEEFMNSRGLQEDWDFSRSMIMPSFASLSSATAFATPVEVLVDILNRERRLRGLTYNPRTDAVVTPCPQVFFALARGELLVPLVASGILVPSFFGNGNARRAPRAPGALSQVTFYVREWQPHGVNVQTVLEDFAQAYPAQRLWVERVKRRGTVRYVGICIDGEPINRLIEDGEAASSETHATSRLLNFMATSAPAAQWHSYEIVPLRRQLATPTSMPLNDLLRAIGQDETDQQMTVADALAPRGLPPLPLTVTRTMMLKMHNDTIAPVEAALIHACSLGSVCLNSASHGGLDVSRPISLPRPVRDVREAVIQACGQRAFPGFVFNHDLLRECFRLVRTANEAMGANVVSAHMVLAIAIYAALPGPGVHVMKDATREDLAGESTRFGRFAGPGLAVLKHAMAWAFDFALPEDEDMESLIDLNASIDLWPFGCVSAQDGGLERACTLLRDLLLARHRAGHLGYMVLQSAQVFDILANRRGLSTVRPPRLRVTCTNESVAMPQIVRETGVLHVIEVGNLEVPSIATFHGGCIKYNGDPILRADMHLFAHLTAEKTRLLECEVARSTGTARDIVAAVQEASEGLGVEDQLNEVRTRLLQRQYALNSLQYLPRAIAHANSPDDVFWAQEEAWRETGGRLTRGRNDVVAEEDREAQIEALLRHTGGNLLNVSRPKGIGTSVDDVDRWCDWFRSLPTGTSVRQAAAGSHASKGPGYKVRRRLRIISPRIALQVRDAGGYRKALSAYEARRILASTRQKRGHRAGETLYRCSLCMRSALMKIKPDNFLHVCTDGRIEKGADAPTFQKWELKSPWQVDHVLATFAQVQHVEPSEDVWASDSEAMERGGAVLFRWPTRAGVLAMPLVAEGVGWGEALNLTNEVRQIRGSEAARWYTLATADGRLLTNAVSLEQQLRHYVAWPHHRNDWPPYYGLPPHLVARAEAVVVAARNREERERQEEEQEGERERRRRRVDPEGEEQPVEGDGIEGEGEGAGRGRGRARGRARGRGGGRGRERGRGRGRGRGGGRGRGRGRGRARGNGGGEEAA